MVSQWSGSGVNACGEKLIASLAVGSKAFVKNVHALACRGPTRQPPRTDQGIPQNHIFPRKNMVLFSSGILWCLRHPNFFLVWVPMLL